MKKLLKRVMYGLLIFIGILGILYIVGPRPLKPRLMAKIPNMAEDLEQLDKQIKEDEAKVAGMRKDNEARIIWADSTKKVKTPYAFVYLAGFSASQFEGEPLHRELATRYGANLYLSRLYGHGTESKDNLLDFTADKYLESAAQAIAIGKQIGERVILVSCSTGGTLSLILASQNPDIHALMTYSPNIAINNPAATLMDEPWGLDIIRMVHNGSDYHEFDPKDVDDYTKQYWTWRYRIECLTELESLLSNSMTPSTFKAVKCPTYIAAYYKDEANQDPVVSVAAMQTMYQQLGTPATQKRIELFPEANTHVIACQLRSKQYEAIRASSFKFVDEILQIAAK